MTTPPPPPPPMGMAPKANNGKALASMIIGIVSVALFCYWFISIPGGIVALILGVMARKDIARGNGTNGGMAMAGIITGAIGALFGVVLLVLGLMGTGLSGYCADNPNSAFCTGQ